MGADPENYWQTVLVEVFAQKNYYYQVRPIFTYKTNPTFVTSNDSPMLSNLPIFNQYSGNYDIGLNNTLYNRVLIKMKDPDNQA